MNRVTGNIERGEGNQKLTPTPQKNVLEEVEVLEPERVGRAKFAYTTRRVDRSRISTLLLSKKRSNKFNSTIRKSRLWIGRLKVAM